MTRMRAAILTAMCICEVLAITGGIELYYKHTWTEFCQERGFDGAFHAGGLQWFCKLKIVPMVEDRTDYGPDEPTRVVEEESIDVQAADEYAVQAWNARFERQEYDRIHAK